MNLGLGTVQFGLDYGVSNAAGRTTAAEAGRILALARRERIEVLDTAASYGESEATIGAAADAAFQVVTKTPAFASPDISGDEAATLRTTFERSLDRLRRSRIYGLLAHSPADLLKPGGERLWQEMTALKRAGLVSKIGYSVYDGSALDALAARYVPDLVQVPVNVLDQRLIRDGHLAALKAQGVEVHARSVFLQGLLLMAPGDLPAHLSAFRPALDAYASFLALNGIGRLETALRFVRGVREIDVALVGVNDAIQLEACVAAFRAGPLDVDASALASDNMALLNPSNWPKAAPAAAANA